MSKFDSYKYWLDQLEGRSAATKELYTIYFKKFCEYAKATPDALVEMQRKAMEGNGDPRENHVVESKVRAWIASERDSKSTQTRKSMLTAVKSFFTLNLHPLRMLRMDVPQGESKGSRIPEKEEVILMADAAKWKYRAAVMFLKDSGLRISDVVRVRWEDRVDMGSGFWNFNLLTRKKQVQACAFVGPETTRLLEQFKTKTGRIFKTAKEHMGDEINVLTKKAELEGVTAHGLRKYFLTSMEHARVPEQYYLHMMGKKSSVYSEKRRSELFKEYKRGYPELSIYAVQERDKQLQEQAKKIASLEDQVKMLMNVMRLAAKGEAPIGIATIDGKEIAVVKMKDKDVVEKLGVKPETLAEAKKKLREIEAKKRQSQKE